MENVLLFLMCVSTPFSAGQFLGHAEERHPGRQDKNGFRPLYPLSVIGQDQRSPSGYLTRAIWGFAAIPEPPTLSSEVWLPASPHPWLVFCLPSRISTWRQFLRLCFPSASVWAIARLTVY